VKPNQYPLVLVEWLDHSGTTGWQSPEEAAAHDGFIVKSIGWMIRSDKTCKVLVGAVTNENHVSNVQTILTPLIRKITTIRRKGR
jgi:hypothetical protein